MEVERQPTTNIFIALDFVADCDCTGTVDGGGRTIREVPRLSNKLDLEHGFMIQTF